MSAQIILRRSLLPLDDLPACCAWCGRGPVTQVELGLPYTSDKAPQHKTEGIDVALHIAHGWASMIAGLYVLTRNILTTRRLRIWLPLCARHESSAWWQRVGLRWLSILLTLSTLGAMVVMGYWIYHGAFKNLTEEERVLKFSAYFMTLLTLGGGALLARARLHDGFIYTVNVDEEWVQLGGISELFASQLTSVESINSANAIRLPRETTESH